MTAILIRANCKLIFFGNSDSLPPMALFAKNLLVHFCLIITHIVILQNMYNYILHCQAFPQSQP